MHYTQVYISASTYNNSSQQMLTVECIIVVDALQPSRTSMRRRSCLRAMAGSITMMSPDMLASQLRIELLLQRNHVTRTWQTRSLRHYALQKPWTLERCNPWPRRQSPYLHKPAVISHCDVILVMTSFATELATPSTTDLWTYVRTPYRV